MKRTPLCALLLALLCAFARADPQYPTWPKDQVEKASDWKMIFFQDDNKVFHKLYCRVKECMPSGKPAAGQLFVLTQSKKDVPDGWMPGSGAKGFFAATLSHYSLVDGKIVRDDGHAGPALDLAKDMSDVDWRRYTSLTVAPPTAMAKDGAPAGTGAAQRPKPSPTPTPTPTPLPPDLNAKLDAALKDYSPIERAIIKHVATKEELQQIADNKVPKDKNWHKIALDKARHDTDNPPNHPLLDYLKTQTFTDKDYASYVGCDALLGGPAPAGGDTTATLEVLKRQYVQLNLPAGPEPEAIKSQADVFSAVSKLYPNLQKYCQDNANAAKVVEQQKPGGPEQSLSVLPPPAPGGISPGSRNDPVPSAPPAGSKKDDGGGKKDKLTDMLFKGTLGGMAGGFGGLIVASLLGLGPLGIFGLAIGGALAGAFLATNHMPKKDKGSGGS